MSSGSTRQKKAASLVQESILDEPEGQVSLEFPHVERLLLPRPFSDRTPVP